MGVILIIWWFLTPTYFQLTGSDFWRRLKNFSFWRERLALLASLRSATINLSLTVWWRDLYNRRSDSKRLVDRSNEFILRFSDIGSPVLRIAGQLAELVGACAQPRAGAVRAIGGEWQLLLHRAAFFGFLWSKKLQFEIQQLKLWSNGGQSDYARGLCLLGGDSIQGTVSFHALFKYNRIRIEPIYNNGVEILWREFRVQRLYLNFI